MTKTDIEQKKRKVILILRFIRFSTLYMSKAGCPK